MFDRNLFLICIFENDGVLRHLVVAKLLHGVHEADLNLRSRLIRGALPACRLSRIVESQSFVGFRDVLNEAVAKDSGRKHFGVLLSVGLRR